MKSMNVREAKAVFSALIDAAERGEPIAITRHGKPVAAIVPIEVARKLYPERPNLIDHLMTFPGFPEGFEPERNSSPGRGVDL